jgi:hypothetical protein
VLFFQAFLNLFVPIIQLDPHGLILNNSTGILIFHNRLNRRHNMTSCDKGLCRHLSRNHCTLFFFFFFFYFLAVCASVFYPLKCNMIFKIFIKFERIIINFFDFFFLIFKTNENRETTIFFFLFYAIQRGRNF